MRRVATSVDPWGKVLTMTYDAAGNRTQLQDSDGGTTDSTFDALGRLTNRKYTESSTVKMSVTQVYDAAGRMSEQWRYGESYALVARTSLTYDAGDRLTNLQHRDGSGNNIANYTYVHSGRATTKEPRWWWVLVREQVAALGLGQTSFEESAAGRQRRLFFGWVADPFVFSPLFFLFFPSAE